MSAVQDRSAEGYRGPLNSDASSLTTRDFAQPLVETSARHYTISRSRFETDSNALETTREQEFNILADRWHRETRLCSSATKMAMHPAYQRIIGLGPGVLPFILRDLQQTRSHWLWALHILSRFQDPAPKGASFNEAVDAWLKWGRAQGLLS
jgi:hypothetical protein